MIRIICTMSINLPTYTGTIGSLTTTNDITIGGNLRINGSLMALSYTSNAVQAITATVETPVMFQTQVSNTLSTCTLSNSNSRFTYTGTPTTLWLVTANCRTDNASTAANNGVALWVRKNKAGAYYGETYVSTYGYAVCSLNCTCMIPMSTNDYIEVSLYPTANLSISANNTFSASAVTIAQI
jgi:hypothetical protein